jgi:hypothetical protein
MIHLHIILDFMYRPPFPPEFSISIAITYRLIPSEKHKPDVSPDVRMKTAFYQTISELLPKISKVNPAHGIF